MKDHPRFQITSHQLLFMIVGSTIATGILSLPRVASGDAQQDAWIAVIAGAVVPFVSLFLMDRLGKFFPDLTIVEMTQLLMGKFIGSIITVLFILYIVFIQGIILRSGTEIISMYSLPKTPISVTSLLITLVVIYITAKGGKVIGRLNEILFFILIFNFVLLVPMPNMIDHTNLLPIGGTGFMGIAKSALPTAFAYGGIEILFIAYPMVTRKDKIFKSALAAVFIIMFLYLQVTITGLLIFGVEAMQLLMWPVLIILKVINIPLLNRLEFIFLLLWAAVIVRPVVNHGFMAALSLTQLFKLDINKYYFFTVVIISFLIYSVSLIPRNIVEVFKWVEYGGYAFLIFSIGYPLLLYLTALMRKGKVKQYG